MDNDARTVFDVSTLGRPRMSKVKEKAIARELSPALAWPTLTLAILLPGLYVLFVALGLTGNVPLLLCAVILTLVSYAHYTLVHEAVHGNIVARPRGMAWVNYVIGWIGSLGLGVGWPLLQRTHVLHHSHTNTDKDPDIGVKGSFGALFPKWLRDCVLGVVPPNLLIVLIPSVGRQLGPILTGAEILQCSIVTLLNWGLFILSAATNHLTEWLLLWFVPTQVAGLILMIFFQWLPHHPFDHFDRYRATRISLWPAGALLTLQQNLHLVHHLWPSVPFYNYTRLFRAIQPVLEAEGSRIECFIPFSRPPNDSTGLSAE